ncbi:hypothetical protein V2A60_001822 [Cordyceps javanica]|uniref:Phosphotransferase enzyme family protein n=1 Tax=Cordyceps javanica TaxID=43265 RepID=A0A545VGC1_9HYPO|nr:phosphotransferase enzyme family protein [Cordyceps javanica]TQW11960.1 phosphotransferase enzyme family protein [Cordyceps javanica]
MTDQAQKYLHHSFICTIMASLFGIAKHDLAIEQNPVATNNHVYMITLSQPVEFSKTSADAKPFTVAVPAGTSHMVIRIARADNNVEDSIRIRNEVAFLTLARRALGQLDPLLIPRVFAWDDTTELGYILQEFKRGEPLSHDDFQALNEQDVSFVCSQLATVIKAFQNYQLPVDGYGGLTFDDAGNMSTTKVIFRTGGPFVTYTDYLKATLKWQLAQSENVTVLNGWRGVPGLRSRIDAFISNGLDKVLSKIPESKPTLVHGDLTLPNLLFDRHTKRLMAVVDFDFGHVGSIVTEFLYSFPEFQGILTGVAEPEDNLRDLVLNGFVDPVDAKFSIGKAWDQALATQGVLRPCTIEGSDDVSNVWWFAQDLMQFHWLLPRFYANQSDEQIRTWREKSRKNIEAYLENWGY